MMPTNQLDLAKVFWEQSRNAVTQAHQAWDMVIRSQKSLMDSMRSAGAPYAQAADQFDKMMDFHAEQYKAAMEFMDRMSAEYMQMLERQSKKP
jgi:hypothetical protein